LALGVLFYGAAELVPMPQFLFSVCKYLAAINWILAIFNLIPAFPLDGGRILRALLWHWQGNLLRATRTASRIGVLLSYLLIGYGVMQMLFTSLIGGIWFIVLGAFLQNAARQSYEQLVVRGALAGELVSSFMNKEAITVSPTLSVQELIDQYVYHFHHRMFPIVSEGQLVGSVSLQEVKKVAIEQRNAMTVAEIMLPQTELNTVGPTTKVTEALAIMNRTGFSQLLVVDDEGHLAGIITMQDLLKILALHAQLDEEKLSA
jgi:CBS domain-containing protein